MLAAKTHGPNTSTRERALELLSAGYGAEVVASTLGVSASAISQLLSEEDFSREVASRRFNNLQSTNLRDQKIDALEDRMLNQLESLVPLITRPMEAVRAAATINAMKRRGVSAPEQQIQQNMVVNLALPATLIHKFQVSAQNQVVSVSVETPALESPTTEQTLVTMQSSSLLAKIRQQKLEQISGAQEVTYHEQKLGGTVQTNDS